MKYRTGLANQIIERVIESTEKNVNVSLMAGKIGVPTPTLWNKVAHKKRWDADTWLEVLWALKFAKYTKDGYIKIRCPLERHEVMKLNSFSECNFFI